jgi:hypothetical protein
METKRPSSTTRLHDLKPVNTSSRSAEHMRRIIAAHAEVRRANAELRRAVRAACEAGDSWAMIGAALGAPPRSASERFGRQPGPDRS